MEGTILGWSEEPLFEEMKFKQTLEVRKQTMKMSGKERSRPGE